MSDKTVWERIFGRQCTTPVEGFLCVSGMCE